MLLPEPIPRLHIISIGYIIIKSGYFHHNAGLHQSKNIFTATSKFIETVTTITKIWTSIRVSWIPS